MDAERFRDRVALVTGAASGIGFKLAQRFVAEGARVCAADIAKPGLETLEKAVGNTDRLLTRTVDVTSEADGQAAVEAVERRWGRLDILVNNAGIYPAQRFEDISLADWRRVMAVNLDGAFLMTRAAMPGMKRRRWGRVICLSSGTVWLGTPLYAHYVAAKAGIIGFTRALASEVGEHNVTVNAVSPGLTLTDTVRRTVRESLLEQRKLQRPIKRDLEADHIVGAILFLASDDADLITGQTINVDGGVAMH